MDGVVASESYVAPVIISDTCMDPGQNLMCCASDIISDIHGLRDTTYIEPTIHHQAEPRVLVVDAYM